MGEGRRGDGKLNRQRSLIDVYQSYRCSHRNQTSVTMSNIPKVPAIAHIPRTKGGDVTKFGSALHQIMVIWEQLTIVRPTHEIQILRAREYTQNLERAEGNCVHCLSLLCVHYSLPPLYMVGTVLRIEGVAGSAHLIIANHFCPHLSHYIIDQHPPNHTFGEEVESWCGPDIWEIPPDRARFRFRLH